MHTSIIGVVIGTVVVMLWGLLGLYCWCCDRRRRQWQARWDEFAAEQSRLDTELDRTWEYLQR